MNWITRLQHHSFNNNNRNIIRFNNNRNIIRFNNNRNLTRFNNNIIRINNNNLWDTHFFNQWFNNLNFNSYQRNNINNLIHLRFNLNCFNYSIQSSFFLVLSRSIDHFLKRRFHRFYRIILLKQKTIKARCVRHISNNI